MAVTIVWKGDRVESGTPRQVFALPAWRADWGYEPSPDGQRFLLLLGVSEASPINVILNWKPPTR